MVRVRVRMRLFLVRVAYVRYQSCSYLKVKEDEHEKAASFIVSGEKVPTYASVTSFKDDYKNDDDGISIILS